VDAMSANDRRLATNNEKLQSNL